MRACVVTYTQTSKQTEEHASLNGHRCEKNLFFVGSAMTHTRIALFTSFWIIHVQVLCASFRNIRVLFAYIIFSTYSTIHIHRCLNCCCCGGGVLCHMYTAMSVKKITAIHLCIFGERYKKYTLFASHTAILLSGVAVYAPKPTEPGTCSRQQGCRGKDGRRLESQEGRSCEDDLSNHIVVLLSLHNKTACGWKKS